MAPSCRSSHQFCYEDCRLSTFKTLLESNVATLMTPEARLPEDVMPRIVGLLGEKLPGEPITLDIARAAPFSFFGGLAVSARYADDLRAAIKLLVKNCSVISNQLELTFCESASETKIISKHPMKHIDGGRSAEIRPAFIVRLFTEFWKYGTASSASRSTMHHTSTRDNTRAVSTCPWSSTRMRAALSSNQRSQMLGSSRQMLGFSTTSRRTYPASISRLLQLKSRRS